MTERLPLTERKRLQVRARIVAAADALFAEQGFDAVSVTQIADRADVGRTTLFRHFGDKQEVVFAQEQQLMVTIATAHDEHEVPAPTTAHEAIGQLRAVVLALCDRATEDPLSYNRHFELVEGHPELQARDALKMLQFADRLAEMLIARGATEPIAVFASQVALACYQTARRRHGNNPGSLTADADDAFHWVLHLERAQ